MKRGSYRENVLDHDQRTLPGWEDRPSAALEGSECGEGKKGGQHQMPVSRAENHKIFLKRQISKIQADRTERAVEGPMIPTQEMTKA